MSMSVEKLRQYGFGKNIKPPEPQWIARVVLYGKGRKVLGLDFIPKATIKRSAEARCEYVETESVAVNIPVEYENGKQPKIKHIMLELRRDPLGDNPWTEYETRLPTGKWVIEGTDAGTYSVTVPKNPFVKVADPF